MPNQDISLSAYDPQVAAIQRQQRLAEMLQQQASQDIPITSSGGIQAPISPFQGLAKILQAYGSKKMQDRAEAGMAAYRDKDSASAQALVKQLTMPGYQPGAANTTQLDPTTPQLPGQAAPSPQQPVTLPYANANGQMPAQTLPNQQAQLAMLLGADGGPQTQALRGAMLPQIMQRQNLDYQHQLGREDADYARGQPLSVAAQQTIDAQNKSERELAQFKNDLPMTAKDRAELAESHSYHQSLTGGSYALGADGLPQTDDPITQAYVKGFTSGNITSMNQVPKSHRDRVALALTQTPDVSYNPLAMRRLTLASSAITKQFTDMPQYQLTAAAPVYLDRINAALKTKGSVSDQDLLDSLTKLNTGGNAVTDAQVRLITDGKSLADRFGVWSNTVKNGGVLSDNQRDQIKQIANDIAGNYRKGYEPIYAQASKQLHEAGIPEKFWTIPDLNKLKVDTGTAPAANAADPNADAKAWLAANPTDPRAAAVRAKLGMK